MNQPVLIGFAESLAAIEAAWCLAEDGFEMHAFTRRGSRPALARSGSVRIIEVAPPEDDAPRCAAELAALVRDIRPAAVLPLDDHAVWLLNQVPPSSADGPATVAGPTGHLTSLALDKRDQLQLASAAGLAVPPTADPGDPPPGPGPWMVKPALAVELRGGKLYRPAGRIATAPEQVPAIAARIGGPVLVQQMIDGVGEGVFGLAVGGTAMALSAHRRIRMMNPRGSGSSACRSAPVAADVVAPVLELISKCGWHGLFMVELLRDTAGQPWFMELNGRAWGSMALARYRGYRYPSWAVQAAIEPEFRPAVPAEPPEITARHLGREVVHLAMVLARGGAPRLATVREVLTVRRSDRWYNYRPGEVRVFAADTWDTVRGQVAPGMHRLSARITRRSR